MAQIKKAVFLDRDGTIARDVPYCSRPEDFELLPGVSEGIRLLNEAGFKVIVITNQSGVSRGYFTKEMLEEIHQKMKDDLSKFGAHIDGIYFCPHHPDQGCDCRKPKPTLIYQATQAHGIQLDESFFIGDMPLDVVAGYAAGCKACLISSSRTWERNRYSTVEPDFVAHDFLDACSWVVIPKGLK